MSPAPVSRSLTTLLLLLCYSVSGSASSAVPVVTTPAPPVPAASTKSNGNPVFQMVGYVKDTLSRTVTGCGELWSNHGRCNEIRNKMKAHRQRVKEVWTEQGLYSPNSQYTPKQLNQQLEALNGGISYEEYAFLQKGKEDRGRVLNLCFLVFGAPKFLPYALMFNPEMLPSPLQPPPVGDSVMEKKSRDRTSEIIQTLLKLDRDAKEMSGFSKINIFGRAKQEQKMQELQHFNQQTVGFLKTSMNQPNAGRQLLDRLRPYLVKANEDFTRDEKRLCQVPNTVIKGLVHSISGGGGFFSSVAPMVMTRGKLITHLQKVEQADDFIMSTKVNITTISPQLLREACNDRLIGTPKSTITELQSSLAEWLTLVQSPTVADGATLTASNAATTASKPTIHYNSNLARAALFSFYGLQGLRHDRNEQSAMPRLLFSTSPDALEASNEKKSKKGKRQN